MLRRRPDNPIKKEERLPIKKEGGRERRFNKNLERLEKK